MQRQIAVGIFEVLLHGGKRPVYPLAYGDARYHDDELAPAVAPVQLEHGFDVAIGLARAGFHLDIKIGTKIRLVLPDILSGAVLQGFGNGQVLTQLHLLDVFQQLLPGKGNLGVF